MKKNKNIPLRVINTGSLQRIANAIEGIHNCLIELNAANRRKENKKKKKQ